MEGTNVGAEMENAAALRGRLARVAGSMATTLSYGSRALVLVWATNRPLSIMLGLLTVVSGLLPAMIAYTGAQIVDAVVAGVAGSGPDHRLALELVVLEALLVVALAGANRGTNFAQALLKAQLGQRVSRMILEKAISLDLAQLEDSEIYDKQMRVRREAQTRPLSVVMRTFALLQSMVSLASIGALLVSLSPWALVVLFLCGVPALIAEAKFSNDAFSLFRWRSPEGRMQLYLETVLSRDDHAKEVRLFGLGQPLLARHEAIYRKLYGADRALSVRRHSWGFVLGLLGTASLYSVYVWIVLEALAAKLTLGQMTMYLMLFRQGQTAMSSGLVALGGMYEDNLYLSALYDYMETPVPAKQGMATSGRLPGDGVRFEDVTFHYPGSPTPILLHLNLHIRPSRSLALVGDNGSGKTTLIKLLTRLYVPTKGRLLLDGTDLQDWDEAALRERIGVIFQDFGRYQMLLGENIGAGDTSAFDDETRWREAAELAGATPLVESMPLGYRTQLGKWFKNGRELSGGQWQSIALSRALVRSNADILVLDEPTSALDAAAEAEVFDRFRRLAKGKMAILISHRFSTVRLADEIVVLRSGAVLEQGSHADLMEQQGTYARLFTLQADAYR